jgi:hypothetical protein
MMVGWTVTESLMTVAGRVNLDNLRFLSCGCHRDGDNAGDREEIRKRREAVKLESAIQESDFNVVVGSAANNGALMESSVVWRCM